MTEKFTLSPDDNEEIDVKIAEIETPVEPYIAVSILIGLAVLAIMNLIFESSTTIIIVAALSGFMAWLILTAINLPLSHLITCTFAGVIGVLLNTNSNFIRDHDLTKFSLIFVIIGAFYGYTAYRFTKETRDVSQLIYFVLFSSFIVRGIILIKTGY